MGSKPQFRPFEATDKKSCLTLFDRNSPEYFSPNERMEYAQFLDSRPDYYQVCILDNHVIGAYGIYTASGSCASLHWILFSPPVQGHGLGSIVMSLAIEELKEKKIPLLNISASHKSAPFFARFGAKDIKTTPDGWGHGMHRIDMELKY
jgi:N-acetylglutamate synthase-like GNAT family acetyltransferase